MPDHPGADRAGGQAADDFARRLADLPDEVTAVDVAALRRDFPDRDPEQISATLTQERLRRRATARFGAVARALSWTEAGMQQASRPPVARYRAGRIVATGATEFVDLGCGLGLDAAAAARAGLRVTAVERDPATAVLAQRNLAVLAPGATVRVDVADARDRTVPSGAVAFCDPARRSGHHADGRPKRERDPESWAPPWSWVTGLGAAHPALVVKAAPGLRHALIPAGVSAEWVSVAGDLVEATLWWPGVGGDGSRAAVALHPAADPWREPQVHRLVGDPVPAEPRDLAALLIEPDAAVIRAGLVGALADTTGCGVVSAGIAYLTGDVAPDPVWARSWPVLDVLPARVRPLRAALVARGIGSLEIRTRGLALDPARFRRDLALPPGSPGHLVLTRLAGRAAAVLVGKPVT